MRSTWLHIAGYVITLALGVSIALVSVDGSASSSDVLEAQANGSITLEMIDLLMQEQIEDAIYLQASEAEHYLTYAMVLGRGNVEDAKLMQPLLDYAQYLGEQRPGLWSNVFDSTRVDYQTWLAGLN